MGITSEVPEMPTLIERIEALLSRGEQHVHDNLEAMIAALEAEREGDGGESMPVVTENPGRPTPEDLATGAGDPSDKLAKVAAQYTTDQQSINTNQVGLVPDSIAKDIASGK